MARKKSFLESQKRPDTKSLRGREAGTSTRNKQGIQVGSKARRKKPVSEQGVMVDVKGSKPKKKSIAYKTGTAIGKALGIKNKKTKPKAKKKAAKKISGVGRKYKF